MSTEFAMFDGHTANLLVESLRAHDVVRGGDDSAKPILLEAVRSAIEKYFSAGVDEIPDALKEYIEGLSEEDWDEGDGVISLEERAEWVIEGAKVDSLIMQDLYNRIESMSDEEAEVVMRKYERQRDGFAYGTRELCDNPLSTPKDFPHTKFVWDDSDVEIRKITIE